MQPCGTRGQAGAAGPEEAVALAEVGWLFPEEFVRMWETTEGSMTRVGAGAAKVKFGPKAPNHWALICFSTDAEGR